MLPTSNRTAAALAFAFLFLAGCNGGNSGPGGIWVWKGGSDTRDAAGVYGALGQRGAQSVPGAREAAATWTDANGNFWLFGGGGYDSAGADGDLNDLWMYDPASAQWTWEAGSNTMGAAGVYGTLGQPDPQSVPGARAGAVAWTDASGNLWLFGGGAVDSTGTYGDFNDLWEFVPSSGR